LDIANTDKSIDIRFYNDMPTLAEIMQIVGKPNAVEITSSEDNSSFWCQTIYFIRDNIVYSFTIVNRSECLNPNHKIDNMYLRVYKPVEYTENPTWIGFATLERYLEIYQNNLKETYK